MTVRTLLTALFLLWVTLVGTVPLAAAVRLTFYSKEFGSSFPHAFVAVRSTADGKDVEATYGFTAKTISPAVLMGSVAGAVVPAAPEYVARSERHFSLDLSDQEYAQVMAVVEAWRLAPQPSYNLARRNCVHFVAEIAAAIGLVGDLPRKLAKKPRSFLIWLTDQNRDKLAARGALIEYKGRRAKS